MSNKWIYPVLGIGIASAIVYVFVFKKDKSYEPPPAPNPEDIDPVVPQDGSGTTDKLYPEAIANNVP